MVQDLVKGQKVSLENLKNFIIGIKWNQENFSNYDIDTSLMLLSERNKLEKEEDFIFYNNPKSISGSSILNTESFNDYKKNFSINLELVPDDISRLMFILTIDNGDKLNQRFGNINDIEIDIVDKASNNCAFKYSVTGLSNETAVILIEIYRNNNIWKLQTTGNGFNAGLDKIIEQYGSDKVKVADTQSQSVNIEKDITNQVNEIPVTKAPEKSTISLTKITLEKKGDVAKINLTKSRLENIHSKLFWKKGVDLDLHAFYKNKNGKTGHIYFGSKGKLHTEPYIQLDQDSGVGNIAGDNEENLRITNLDYFDYILFSVNIFRFFSKKGENFARYDGRLVLATDRGDEIKVPLISEEIGTWCVIAMLDNTNTSEPRIVNINQVLKTEPVIDNFRNL